MFIREQRCERAEGEVALGHRPNEALSGPAGSSEQGVFKAQASLPTSRSQGVRHARGV